MESNLTQNTSDLVKVVLFGPESTGKTTLSRQLAAHYNTVWVPEFARTYLQKKWDEQKKRCEPEDILPIALGQIGLENKQTLKANNVLICDTDLLETQVYSQEYYNGFVPEALEQAVKKHQYDLYLLTYIDTPWTPDDLRDRPDQRQEMFEAFETSLKEHHKQYTLIKGSLSTRFKEAVQCIDKLLETKNQQR